MADIKCTDSSLTVAQVVSAKREKTAKAVIERLVRHPLYNKVVKRRSTVHFHDENNVAKEGDWVALRECRPISKTKSWELVEVLGDNK